MFIKFTEIDLKKPLLPIYVDRRYNRLFVLVSWGYLPLGLIQLACLPDSRFFTLERLNNEILQNFGWKIWEQAIAGTLDSLNENPVYQLPPISVVVCTRDRPLLLEQCLDSLKQLDYPTSEIIVIDNCSRNKSVAQIVAKSGFRYAREDRSGLDWARNKGIDESRYNIIAFIDDDALATKGWLRGIAQGFKNPDIMAVTGNVLPAEIETPAQNDFERYGGMSKGFISYTIRAEDLGVKALFWASSWGVGANMAFRRQLFEAVGYFDVALDVGTATNGAGDLEFFYRTVSNGYLLRYEPAAIVRHLHRRDQMSLNKQIFNNGRSFGCYLMTNFRNEPHRRIAVSWFALRWWILDWILRRLFIGIKKRDRETLRLAATELRGCLSAPWAYWKSRKRIKKLLIKDCSTSSGNQLINKTES